MAAGGPPAPGGEPGRFEPDLLDGLPAELAMARLPAGRHGLPREFVAHNQRLRLVAAMLRVLPERGYPALTIGHVTSEAAVSRAAFYQQFAGKEECFLTTYDLAGEWFCERVERTVAGEEDWRDRIRLGAAEALRLLGANPLVAHLMAVEAPQAGRAARERQQAMLDRFATVLRAGHPGRPELQADLADLLLGGVVALIARYVDGDRAERLPEATAVLVEYLLIPYIGGEEAKAVLASLPEAG
ncbi:MAG TPA: helix-turn-helix domain-containing protein [Solirubrobacterales bacterium]|jgi:AcrR family transcriptional regulator|nr:helix-turn-helix domain-containing protein [Solirubrobacterales bacterium]